MCALSAPRGGHHTNDEFDRNKSFQKHNVFLTSTQNTEIMGKIHVCAMRSSRLLFDLIPSRELSPPNSSIGDFFLFRLL